MFEAMEWLQANRDDLRLRMLREPRGYPAANCNLILKPAHPAADAGYVIMEQVEYPAMSGTNTICVVTVLLETGMLPMIEPVTELTLEAPAGVIRVRADCKDGKVTAGHVPQRSRVRDAPRGAGRGAAAGHGRRRRRVRRDVLRHRRGGAVRAAGSPRTRARDIVRITEMIKAAANEQLPVVHPGQPGFSGITIGAAVGPAHDPANSRRNVVTVSTGTLDWERPATWTGAIDRSPCGTGTCAKMAVLHAKGELAVGDAFRHEGILGTVFTGRLVEETTVGPYRAVVPTITGQAWITGFASYVVDPTDPFPDGFTIGDIWG